MRFVSSGRSPWLLFMISVVTLLTSGCDKGTKEAIEPVIRPAKLFQVKDPEQQRLRYFPGKVTATEEAEISFRIPGQLDTLVVKQGDDVVKGQILAHLDDRDIRNELQDRQANYELLQNEFERAQSLIKKKVISQSDYDSASAKLKSAKAALELARDKLEYSTLKAPFRGRVAQTLVENHQQVQAQQAVLVLQSSNMLDISIQMPESIVSQVDKDSVDHNYRPLVTFPGAPGKNYPISYKEHSTKVTQGTQSYEVLFSLPTPHDLNVLPGMSATVIMDLAKIMTLQKRDHYILVPLSAVARDDATNQTVVWRYDEASSQVSPVNVQAGRITESGIQIIAGLKPGDQIVTAGLSQLTDGMKVKPLRIERGL